MSKKNKLLIIFVLFIIALLVLFYIEKAKKVIAPEREPTNITSYYCTEGTLKVVYEKNEAEVTFPDGKIEAFTQTVSADGGRYASGQDVFWSKGDGAFVMNGDKNIYTNCVTGNQTTTGDTNTYTDPGKTFSFSYPKEFTLSGGDRSYTADWRENTESLGLLFTVVQIPKLFLPGTNFGDAKFTVGTSADPAALKNCLLAQNGEVIKSEKVTINDTSFTEIILSDAGAGNFYQTTSYRTVRNSQCYAIEYTVHSTNIDNYSPNQGIKEFDQAKITSILEGMVQSFKFL